MLSRLSSTLSSWLCGVRVCVVVFIVNFTISYRIVLSFIFFFPLDYSFSNIYFLSFVSCFAYSRSLYFFHQFCCLYCQRVFRIRRSYLCRIKAGTYVINTHPSFVAKNKCKRQQRNRERESEKKKKSRKFCSKISIWNRNDVVSANYFVWDVDIFIFFASNLRVELFALTESRYT